MHRGLYRDQISPERIQAMNVLKFSLIIAFSACSFFNVSEADGPSKDWCLECHENHKDDPKDGSFPCDDNFACVVVALTSNFQNFEECNEFFNSRGFFTKLCNRRFNQPLST